MNKARRGRALQGGAGLAYLLATGAVTAAGVVALGAVGVSPAWNFTTAAR